MKSVRTASADRRPVRVYQMLCGLFLWMIASAQPASAQAFTGHTRPWYIMILDLHTLPYVIGTAVFCYLLSIVLTMLFMRNGYPPNVARFAVWFGLLIWLILVFGVIFHFVLLITFPLWFLIALLLFIAAFGIILLTTKRQSA